MRMMRFIILSFLLASLFACESEPKYEDVSGEPNIYFRGTLDGEYLNWEAGVENEYNFTSIEVNEFDFYDLHSVLADIDGEGPELEVVLLDPAEVDDDISDELRFATGTRPYLYQPEAISSYTLRLHSSQLTNYLYDYEWITDEGIYHSSDPEITFDQPGSELICLKGLTPDGDTIHTCKRINLDQNRWVSPSLQIIEKTPDSITVEADIENMLCDRWEWNGYILEDYAFAIARDDWTDKLVHLRMYNNSFLLSDIVFRGEVDGNSDEHIGWAGFSSEPVNRKIKDRLQHGKIVINYTHPENGLFSSKYVQGQDNYFELIEAEPFEVNENGIRTLLLTLKFRATLATELGHEMTIESEEVKMAFPVPES
jgi:hypothetical protein